MTVPTIGQLANGRGMGQRIARCRAAQAALPWRAVIDRLGADASGDRLRRALRCTVCGHKGGTLTVVTRPRYQDPPPSIPWHRVPAWARLQPPTWSR